MKKENAEIDKTEKGGIRAILFKWGMPLKYDQVFQMIVAMKQCHLLVLTYSWFFLARKNLVGASNLLFRLSWRFWKVTRNLG